MTITKQIEVARKFLLTGNTKAYAQSMSGSIRAAMSDRAAKAFREAIAEDKTETLFRGLGTACPVAA